MSLAADASTVRAGQGNVRVAGPAGAQGPNGTAAGKGEAQKEDKGKAAEAQQGEGEGDDEEEDLFQGASLETDPEIRTLLVRAQELVDAKQYELAIRLLQRVLDTGGQAMVHHEGKVFRPASWYAMTLLAALPPEGLNLYRVAADASAGALLAGAGADRDAEALQKVCERYFLSSYGDEAAFSLACLCINRGDFWRARRLLQEILDFHPQASVPRAQVLLRLAFVAARLGDRAGAEQYWQTLSHTPAADRPAGWQQVERDMQAHAKQALTPQAAQDWRMPYGSSRRDGLMPTVRSVVNGECANGLAVLWHESLPLDLKASSDPNPQANRYNRGAYPLPLLVRLWRQEGRHPTDELVVHDGRIYMSSAPGLYCFDAQSGRRLWEAHIPAKSKASGGGVHHVFVQPMGLYASPQQTWGFHDRINRCLCVIEDTLYRVEENHHAVRSVRRERKGKNWVQITVAHGSYLAAYDLDSGKRRWRIGQGKTEDAPLYGARFMHAPVRCGRQLLVTVEKRDGLSLLALEPRTGAILWTSFLCSYLAGEQPPWFPVGVAVDGAEVYVASGQGVVFALDGLDGRIRWAAQYERMPRASLDRFGRRVGGTAGQKDAPGGGWDVNAMFPTRDCLLVLPSDTPHLLAFDRASGQLRYQKPQAGATYALGLQDDGLFVAGDDEVRRHNTRTGEVVWRSEIPKTTGYGALMRDALVLPTPDAVVVLDPLSGKERGRVSVHTDAEVPVGNLYTNGTHVYAVGLNHVLALGDADVFLARYNQVVKQEPTAENYLVRGRLLQRLKRFPEAIADFKEAYTRTQADPRRQKLQALQAELADLSQEDPLAGFRKSVKTQRIFMDAFDREALGDKYKILGGAQVQMQDGVLRMTGPHGKYAELQQAISGDFVAAITGWQDTGRLCDVSFRLRLPGGEGKKDTNIDILFGSNYNVRNQIQVNGKRQCETNDYLMELGKHHHVQLFRLGSHILLYADGHKVLDHTLEALPADAKPFVSFYGYSGEHFFDNFSIHSVAAEDVEQLRLALLERKDKEEALHKACMDLRRQGLRDIDVFRRSLVEAHFACARTDHGTALAVLKACEAYLRTPAEHAEALRLQAAAQVRHEHLAAAVDCYTDLIREYGNAMLNVRDKDDDLRLTAGQFAAAQLAALGRQHPEQVNARAEAAAREALTTLRAEPEGRVSALFSLYRYFPQTPLSIEAGLLAAQRAQAAGQTALAEAILISMGRASHVPTAAAAQVALAELYEQRGWQRSARHAWQTLADTCATAEVRRKGKRVQVAQLAGAALARLATTGKHEARAVAPFPPPPYRLLWKDTSAGFNSVIPVPQQAAASDFLRQHVLLRDNRARRVSCRNVHTGEEVWKSKPAPNHMAYSLQMPSRVGHMGLLQNPYGGISAVSLLTGKPLWSWRQEQAKQIRGVYRAYNRMASDRSLICILTNDPELGTVLLGVNAITGTTRWENRLGLRAITQVRMVAGYPMAQVMPNYRQRHRGYELLVFDPLTGRTLNTIRLAVRGQMQWTDQGLLVREERAYVMYGLPDGEPLWSVAIENQDQRRSVFSHILPGQNDALVRDGNVVLRLDLRTGEEKWRQELASLETAQYAQLYLDADGRTGRIQTHGKGGVLLVLDAETGTVRAELRLPANHNWMAPTIPIDKVIPLRYNKRERRKNGSFSFERGYRFMECATGALLSGVELPRQEDLAGTDKRFRHMFHNLTLVDDVVIAYGYNQLFAYGHDPDKPAVLGGAKPETQADDKKPAAPESKTEADGPAAAE